MSELHCECGRRYLDSQEVATLARVGPQRLYNLRSAGKVPEPTATLGERPLWLADVILDWIAAREREPNVRGARTRSNSEKAVRFGERVAREVMAEAIDHTASEPTSSVEAIDQTASEPARFAIVVTAVSPSKWRGSCTCGWTTPPMADQTACKRRGYNHLSTHGQDDPHHT